MTKKVYKQKCFLSVTTKNLNRVILTKSVIFERWDGVKDQKF